MTKQKYIRLLIIFFFLISMVYARESYSQIQSLAGPRIGVTYINPGVSADFLNNEDGKSAFTTQYGWQWESRFADGTDITGLVEWVAVLGGMEHGKFSPTISSIVGFRNSDGLEMGFGPNLSMGGLGMVFAMGITYKSGNLNLPINIIYVPPKNMTTGGWFGSETVEHHFGSAITLMIGFNMTK